MNIYLKNLGFTLSFAILLTLSSCRWPQRAAYPAPREISSSGDVLADTAPKKTIMIFSSTGGGGHMTATTALTAYLGDRYVIRPVNVFAEVLGDFDPIRSIFATYGGEDMYNFFLSRGMAWGGNLWCNAGMWWFASNQVNNVVDYLERYLQKHKPDLLISVIPVINGAVYRAAQNLNIPLIVLPTDLDITTFAYGIKKPDYKHFYFCAPVDDPRVRETFASSQIPEEKLRITGYPVRPQFLEQKDKISVRKELGFPLDKPIVMVMMGASGSRATLGYVRMLARSKVPMHIIVCLGRNKGLLEHMETLVFPDHITVSLMGFTNAVADLMHASDLLITKSGSASTCEALYAHVPFLLDHTANVLFWERLNMTFVEEHGFGGVITSLHRLHHVIRMLFEDDGALLKSMRESMQDYNFPDIKQNIRTLVAEALDTYAAEERENNSCRMKAELLEFNQKGVVQ